MHILTESTQQFEIQLINFFQLSTSSLTENECTELKVVWQSFSCRWIAFEDVLLRGCAPEPSVPVLPCSHSTEPGDGDLRTRDLSRILLFRKDPISRTFMKIKVYIFNWMSAFHLTDLHELLVRSVVSRFCKCFSFSRRNPSLKCRTYNSFNSICSSSACVDQTIMA